MPPDPKPPKKPRRPRKGLKQSPSINYRAYIKSEAWAIVRRAYYAQRKRACALCSATEDLELHHKTYEHLGREVEHLDDLICLCFRCHDEVHQKRSSKNKGAGRPMTRAHRVEVRSAVACPLCGAGRGRPCRSKRGNPRVQNHVERVRAYGDARP